MVGKKTTNSLISLPSFAALTLLSLGVTAVSAGDGPGRKWTSLQRLEEAHLKAWHEARDQWAHQRANPPDGTRRVDTGIYNDYRAVMHIHAEDSNHTGGMRPEVLVAAKEDQVDVVFFADHKGPQQDTWKGFRDGVLFFAGSEDGDGVSRWPLFDPTGKNIVREDLRFMTHIEERYDAPMDGFDGMEVYNCHTDTKDDKEMVDFFKAMIYEPKKFEPYEQLFKRYPDEVFAACQDYWPPITAKWDREMQKRPVTGMAANDSHQNVVLHGWMFDPYEVAFRNLSTHILARELTEPAIRQSLREGHAYVSWDWLCDPKGFGFVAVNNLGVFNMGDPVILVGNTRFYVQLPIPAKVKLFRNGAVVEEKTGAQLTFETKAAGAYRVEAWLAADEEERPWIISNPIYLKEPGLDALAQLPSMETRSNVVVKSNLIYTDGKGEDEEKHKLDIYMPKGKTNSPVFFFIHGGAWTAGDRAQYPPVGNRYASEGIVTVIPSYRLAPKSPFPAQIEDVASAFAWTVGHVAEFGGDTNRIYVGGHSAGGHLAALLTMDTNRLTALRVSPKMIKGAICLSGVFDLSEGKENVFGKDPAVRAAASPLTQIRKDAPPFLVTYCEWDYFPLVPQAKEFHAALVKAGISSKLVYVPKESHISEMLSVAKENDLTARSVRDFILGAAN